MRVRQPQPARDGSDRRYDEACADHARLVLLAFVRECGGQTAAALKLGVNQGTVSRSLDDDNQPSLKVLIALSRLTGRSLDRILGLDLDQPLPSPSGSP